ncbi:hypothetical protein M8J77_020826 [Diaphorina citri]|nr:hypothetical protein M8J77_020826 [Diaphorina citri]
MDWLSPHPSRDLVDPEETGQEDGGANSVEAWRAHFEEKRKEREEKRQYPKAPFWVLEPKTAPKVQFSVENSVEKVSDVFLRAHSLFWDEIRENFYFVDEINRTIIRYTPAQEEMKIAAIEVEGNPLHPSFVIPIVAKNYEYLIGSEHSLYKVEWNGKKNKVSFVQKIQQDNDEKINYGKADPIGRVVIGSQVADPHPVDGEEYVQIRGYVKVYEAPKKFTNVFHVQMEKCTGLAFNWSASHLYVINAVQDEIHVFGYNIYEGKLETKLESIFWSKLAGVKGSPHCLTCDIHDNLWVGCSKSAQIIALDPVDKSILRTISLENNCVDVTSIVFGHSNRDVLYVTTVNSTTGAEEAFDEDYAKRITDSGGLGLSSLLRVWNVNARALADYRARFF